MTEKEAAHFAEMADKACRFLCQNEKYVWSAAIYQLLGHAMKGVKNDQED